MKYNNEVTMEQTFDYLAETDAAKRHASASISPQQRAVVLSLKLTACCFHLEAGMENIASELRRIAELIDQKDTFGESGDFYYCDFGGWKIADPFEENP